MTHKIDKFVYDLTKKQESDTIAIRYKMRRWQDINRLRATTLECRVEAIEKKLEIGACNIIQSIEDQLEEDIDSRF